MCDFGGSLSAHPVLNKFAVALEKPVNALSLEMET